MKPAFTQGDVHEECGIACTSVRTLSSGRKWQSKARVKQLAGGTAASRIAVRWGRGGAQATSPQGSTGASSAQNPHRRRSHCHRCLGPPRPRQRPRLRQRRRRRRSSRRQQRCTPAVGAAWQALRPGRCGPGPCTTTCSTAPTPAPPAARWLLRPVVSQVLPRPVVSQVVPPSHH